MSNSNEEHQNDPATYKAKTLQKFFLFLYEKNAKFEHHDLGWGYKILIYSNSTHSSERVICQFELKMSSTGFLYDELQGLEQVTLYNLISTPEFQSQSWCAELILQWAQFSDWEPDYRNWMNHFLTWQMQGPLGVQKIVMPTQARETRTSQSLGRAQRLMHVHCFDKTFLFSALQPLQMSPEFSFRVDGMVWSLDPHRSSLLLAPEKGLGQRDELVKLSPSIPIEITCSKDEIRLSFWRAWSEQAPWTELIVVLMKTLRLKFHEETANREIPPFKNIILESPLHLADREVLSETQDVSAQELRERLLRFNQKIDIHSRLNLLQ